MHTPAALRRTTFGFAAGRLTLDEPDVGRLLGSLRALNDQVATAIAAEIEALMLARVRVDLRPSELESGVLVSAITRILASSPGPQPRFSRLLTLVRGRSA